MASSVGGLTNPSKLANTIMTEMGVKTNSHTVGEYMECFRKSFLFEKAERWNVKGRKYIGSPVKYYAEDTELRNARLNFRQMERTHLMENVIYCELCRRGYAVDVGVVHTVGPKSDYLENSTITSVNFHSSKDPSPEVHTWMIARSLDPFGNAWKETLGHWSARFPSSAQNDAE